MEYVSLVGAPAFYDLNQACRILVDAFGPCVFLVGSSIQSRNYRDVDVRCMLDDGAYRQLFPAGGGYQDPFWSLLVTSISCWLAHHTGLPLVDFQFQPRSLADAHFGQAPRVPLGVFVRTLPAPP